jgi:hypothetical protein
LYLEEADALGILMFVGIAVGQLFAAAEVREGHAADITIR